MARDNRLPGNVPRPARLHALPPRTLYDKARYLFSKDTNTSSRSTHRILHLASFGDVPGDVYWGDTLDRAIFRERSEAWISRLTPTVPRADCFGSRLHIVATDDCLDAFSRP